jgi:signal transduction histidine kinase
MGAAAVAIGAGIAGRSTADVDVISGFGGTLWPRVAAILADAAVPDGWGETGLGIANYRTLADAVAALLAEAVTLDGLRLDAAFGLVPAKPDAIAAMLGRVGQASRAALAMIIAILLDRLPEAADLLVAARCGLQDSVIRDATDKAAELLLRRLEQQDGIEARIAAGSLADAGLAAARIGRLLKHLGLANADDRRRERLGTARRHLAAACNARFVAGLQEELLAPLSRIGVASTETAALEAAARGLRVLETESRAMGNGSTYDLLLSKATEAISADSMRDRLSQMEQLRLVEILAGSDAALAMLDQA